MIVSWPLPTLIIVDAAVDLLAAIAMADIDVSTEVDLVDADEDAVEIGLNAPADGILPRNEDIPVKLDNLLYSFNKELTVAGSENPDGIPCIKFELLYMPIIAAAIKFGSSRGDINGFWAADDV